MTETAPLIEAGSPIRVSAGTVGTARLTLTNRAPEPRVLAVTALGVDAAWLPPPTRSRVLLPGESIGLDLPLSPAQGTLPAQYPLAVTVQALDPMTDRVTAATAIADLLLVVDAPGSVAVRLSPADTTAVFGRRVDVVVENNGALPASVELRAAAASGMRVELGAARVEVPGGHTVPVRARVRPGRVRFFGTRVRHPFTISAAAGGSPRLAEGSFTSRALLGASAARGVLLLSVVALWVAAAIVFIPKLADHAKRHDTVTAQTAPSGGASGPSGSGSADGNASTGPGGGAGAGAAAANTVQLNGTVGGDAPAGVTVAVAPVSPVDVAEQSTRGARALGFSAAALGTGKVMGEAVTAPADPARTRTTQTTGDGSWTLSNVAKPGYYLVTFSKPGYQTQRFIVDSSAQGTAQPLAVTLQPGQGRLTGTVRGPGGLVGGATVTITDGTNTITTSSNTKSGKGTWSIDGLATPSSYLITVTKNGLSTESKLVQLGPQGSADVPLTLRTGVASLLGRITDPDQQGIGGAQVTATSGNTVRSATSVTTEGSVQGRFILPDLPPGRYTVAITADGYQAQTRRITVSAGSALDPLAVRLDPSSGTLTGHVYGAKHAAEVGAGLTLSSPANTYKTTTASDGSFAFEHVVPGAYVLSTSLFGYQSDTVTVTVRPGTSTPLERVLTPQTGGVLPATAHIQGQVVDARTGGPLTCDRTRLLPEEACSTSTLTITAGVEDPRPSGAAESFATTFTPSEQYTLPDLGRQPTAGLLPGLHTVTISAPGYESATVKVSVPLGGLVTAPTVQLAPRPKLTGMINAGASVPQQPTCVWLLPADSPAPPSDLPCGASGTGAPGCGPGTAWPPGASCTVPDGSTGGLGRYSLVAAAHGNYEVYVRTADPEFRTATGGAAADDVAHSFTAGEAWTYDVTLHRFGQVRTTVRVPGGQGGLVPAVGATVTLLSGAAGAACADLTEVTPAAGYDNGLVTDGAGQVTFRGVAALPAGQQYRVRAKVGSQTSDCVQVDGRLDVTADAAVHLLHPVDVLIGRLVYNFDGQTLPVAGVGVQLGGVSAYDQNGQGISHTWTVTTDAHGCFAIGATAGLGADPAECPGIRAEGTPIVDGGTVLQSAYASVTTKPAPAGFEALDTPKAELSTGGAVNDFTLQPKAIPFTTGTVTRNPAAPTGTVAPLTQATVQVTAATGATAVTAALDAAGAIIWNDPSYGGSGKVRPGTYTVTVGLTGYVSTTATLSCTVQSQSCVFGSPLVLKQLATLTMTTTGVTGARFALYDGDTQLSAQTASGQSVTFDGLLPGHAGYSVRISAAGYRFSTADELNYTLTCSVGSLAAPQPGQSLQCTAALQRLGTISGTVYGLDVPYPATDPRNDLAGAVVTARPCTSTQVAGAVTYCTGVDTDPAHSFQATSVATSTPGSVNYSITGLADRQGLDAGWWVVRADASAQGYCKDLFTAESNCPSPSPAPPSDAVGIAVQVADGATTTVDPMLYRKAIPFTVKATDSAGNAAAGLNMTLSGAPLDAPITVTSTSDSYTFGALIPGTYSLHWEPTSDDSQYVIGSQLVQVISGAPPYPLTVQIAAHVVTGQVTGLQGASTAATPLAGVDVCVVADAGAGCSAAVEGTDGAPLVMQSGPDGTFTFINVPNTPDTGPYYVRYSVYGYQPFVSTPVTLKNAGPSVWIFPAQQLTRVTHRVTVTVEGPVEDDLTDVGGTLSLTSATGSGSVPANGDRLLQRPSSPDNQIVLTDAQVPYGCWTLTGLAGALHDAHHYGTLGTPTGSPADAALGCGSGAITVPGTGDADIAVTIGLTEWQGTLTVTADPNDSGQSAPASVTVTGTAGGSTVVSASVPVGTKTALGWFDATVALSLSGFDTSIWAQDPASAQLTEAAPEETVDLTVPMRSVTIHVQDDDESDVGGAQVSLHVPSAVSWFATPAAKQSDASTGDVSFTIPYATGWTADVSKSGYYAGSADFDTDTDPGTVDVTAWRRSTVTFTVKDQDAAALSGATVTVGGKPAGAPGFTQPGATATGGTTSTDLPYGTTWTAKPALAGYVADTTDFTVDGATESVPLTLYKTKSVQVTVQDGDGPVENATVSISAKPGELSWYSTTIAKTGTNGKTTVTLPYGSGWKLKVNSTTTAALTVDDDDPGAVTITLP